MDDKQTYRTMRDRYVRLRNLIDVYIKEIKTFDGLEADRISLELFKIDESLEDIIKYANSMANKAE